MRLKLIIAYKGTNFQGWQIQEKAKAPPTIQGEIERAFYKISGIKTRLIGSGRTDSGVHAHGQVAHIDMPDLDRWRNLDWRHSLNCVLPSDIRIINVEMAPKDFHARKDVIAKTYIYDYWTESRFIPPYIEDFVWNCGKVDINAMLACLPKLIGRHDFKSFQNAGTPVEDTVRKIYSIKLVNLPKLDFYPSHAPFVRLSICANGFLKQMARNIAGLLWNIGRGKLDIENVEEIIQAKCRESLNAPTAPASGLSLARVYYSHNEVDFKI